MKTMLSTITLLTFAYLWYRYYKIKSKLEENYAEQELDYKKHNCIVTYSKIHGINGWPGFKEGKSHISCLKCDDAFAPLLYFLNTAKVSLDIAVMTVTSNVITDALLSLAKKGVRVRLLVDYDHMAKGHTLKKFKNSGIEAIIYVGSHHSGSIFHYKYVIKDYETDSSAFYCGSLNWTNAAFLNNYENMVFTTNKLIIDRFYSNYNKCLDYINQVMKDDMYVKVKLQDLSNSLKIM